MANKSELNLAPLEAYNKDLPPHMVRFLAYLVGAITVAIGLYTQFFEEELWWLIPVALFYPLLSQGLTRLIRARHSVSTITSLLVIDAAICGVAFVLMDFSVVPSLFIFLIASAGIMTLGGFRGWLGCMAAMLIGSILGIILLGVPTFDLKIPSLFFIISVSVASAGYITILSYYSFKQAKSLLSAQKELEKKQAESTALSRKLAKYLPPQVWGSIFSGQTDAKLQTQRKKLTIFFSDIKGFSEISEELQPEALTELLNNYFTEMSRIALKYGGTIDKFVGDAILIFFGDPTSRGHKQDAVACVSMAIEMRKRMKVLRHSWQQYGINKPLQIRMGINTGYCTVGNFGAETRMDYTIIGKEVNLASRLETVAKPEEILVAETTYNLIRDIIMCRDRDQINVKGFSKPVPIFEIVDLRKELGASQSFVECELEGFSMYVDIDKIRNYDKDRVIQSLESTTKKIKEKLIV
ncbi:MAG: adenylate cyclase [Gammaproteobacteria bacterium]|nr:MAG: adenylate cyclase [Gammaproteobacteria bacterium]